MLTRCIILALILSSASFTFTADPNLGYIEQNISIAQSESLRTGIPVSIKLGQAILESNGGRSVLATRANNHFGIKCKSYWTGGRYFYTDDDRDANGNLVPSCFRMYSDAKSSFIDHSNFLTSSERYSILFTYDKKDYRQWANGLSESGYATNVAYAKSLIRIIEKYNLNQYDN